MSINDSNGSLMINDGRPFADPLKNVNFQTKAEIAKKSTGRALANYLWTMQSKQTDNLNFFVGRAARWREIEQWAMGKQNMQVFLDFMNVNSADKAYVPIDLTPDRSGPQFVGTLVESMSKNEEYPCVTAIDPSSLEEKQERQMDAIFRMKDAQNVNDLQMAGGMQLEPVDAYVPENELAAKIYFELEDRLPKEIRFEKVLERTLTFNKYAKTLKRENIADYIKYNIGATKIERDGDDYRIRKCIKSNLIYSYFQNTSGEWEVSYVAEVEKIKIKDIRSKYLRSAARPDGVTEKEVYDLAKISTKYNLNRAALPDWQNNFMYSGTNTPYDDWSVLVVVGEILIDDVEYAVAKTDSFGNENVAPKKGKPEVKSDKARLVQSASQKWYKYVYAPEADMILYWGPTDIVITDFGNVKKSYSSYTINIPFNNGEYVPSLFERALAPLRELQLTKLKRRQLIAKLSPTGWRIDVAMARNIDLGDGNSIDWTEILRIKDQTGAEIWSSEGLDPNERQTPAISETSHDVTLQKIIELTNVANALMQEIRQLLGVPSYRDGSDVGDRTAAKLADIQNVSSYNVTDFIVSANNELMEQTLYKICILEWQKVVKTEKESLEDLINTRFDVSVRMRLSEYERQLLEQNIQKWSSTVDGNGRPLLSPKDCFRIRNIQNYKLAELYLANVVEENDRKAREESRAQQEQNAQVQMQAAQEKSKGALELAKQEVEGKIATDTAMKTQDKQIKMLDFVSQMVTESMKTGVPVPKQFQPLIDAVLENVMLPMVAQTEEVEEAIAQKDQMMQQQQMAQQQGQDPAMAEQQMQNSPPMT